MVRTQRYSQTTTIRKKTSKRFCPNCGSTDVVLNPDEEFVCTSCGQVSPTQTVDKGPEWRPFLPDSEKRKRVGSPPTPLLRDKGMATFIGFDKRDARGRSMTVKMTKDISR
jgi:transcription initiation factor TFIIIB Brf1 subunit/transcription initiation factor TFIIB